MKASLGDVVSACDLWSLAKCRDETTTPLSWSETVPVILATDF